MLQFEVRAYVDAIESLDSAFDLSHASAPTLPAMHIAAATMVRALGDDAYACELLACAAAEVVELEQGLIPSNPRGRRATPSSSADGASARDALERMRESPSFQNYPANARQMIFSRELWGELVETDAYRKAVAPLG